MTSKSANLKRLLADERGATAVEYAILASLIIAVCVAVILNLGETTNDLFTSFSSSYPVSKP